MHYKIFTLNKNAQPISHSDTAITVGNFDGLHRGHQAILETLVKEAKRKKQQTVLVTFEPYPKEFFQGEKAPARLTTVTDKLRLLKNTNLDYLVCLHFNRDTANISADDFVEKFLVKVLHMKTIIAGDDFRFGCQREGDVKRLLDLSRLHHYELIVIDTLTHQNLRTSSTLVRQLLAAGNFAQASILLGRNYSIYGRVIPGEKLGRKLGFKTANIQLNRLVSPLWGIFAATVLGLGDKPRPAAVSVGRRPTVGGKTMLLEAYLLDWHQDIYGRKIEVVFHKKIRDELKFEDLNALQKQIAADVVEIKKYFGLM